VENDLKRGGNRERKDIYRNQQDYREILNKNCKCRHELSGEVKEIY